MVKFNDLQKISHHYESNQKPVALITRVSSILSGTIDSSWQNEIKRLETRLNEAKKRAKESVKQSSFKRSPEQIRKAKKTLIFILVWAVFLTIFALMLPKDTQKPIERVVKKQKQHVSEGTMSRQFDALSNEAKLLENKGK